MSIPSSVLYVIKAFSQWAWHCAKYFAFFISCNLHNNKGGAIFFSVFIVEEPET